MTLHLNQMIKSRTYTNKNKNQIELSKEKNDDNPYNAAIISFFVLFEFRIKEDKEAVKSNV